MRALRSASLRRVSGAATVFALHAALLFAFLNATRWSVWQTEQTKEIVLHLVPPKAAKVEVLPKRRRKVAAPSSAPNYSLPQNFFEHPPTQSTPQINGFDQPIFDCDPAQLAAATPQQRAACASVSLAPRYNPNDVDYRDHTDRSKSAAQWTRDRARKNSPALLPCISPGWDPLYTATCLAKTAVTGKYNVEEQPGYQDIPQHAVNKGDTRMAPAPH